jgi:hypothetical protein
MTQRTETRYTLAEARLKLNQNECRQDGHSYEITVDQETGMPFRLACSRCGLSWKVQP